MRRYGSMWGSSPSSSVGEGAGADDLGLTREGTMAALGLTQWLCLGLK